MSDPRGGIRRYTESILREFVALNVPNPFFLYSDRPIHPDFVVPNHWKVRSGNLRSPGLGTTFAQLVFPVWSFRDGIDIFWSPRHQLPLLLPPRIRKVLTIHDLVWKRYPETMKRGGRLLEAALTPRSLRNSSQVIADSEFTRSELLTLLPGIARKIDVVYLASSLQMRGASIANPLSSPYFLFVGSAEPRKNLKRLLKAYAEYVKARSMAYDLVIVGADAWGDFDLVQFLRESNLQARVHLFRNVDDDVLQSLYANAHACVMVSIYEGFGLPLVEAMQWGVPLIASENSAMAEIAGDAGILVDPYDLGSIVRGLNKMTDDPELHSNLANAARVRARQFDWAKTASESIDLILGDLRKL